MDKIISFPLVGNYYVPVKYLLNNVGNCKVLDPPNITNKTIELGNKHSPNLYVIHLNIH